MTEMLKTERLVLRRFAPNDVEALLLMCSDERVTRFLPFETLRSAEDAARLLEEKFLSWYRRADEAASSLSAATADAPAGDTEGPLDARWAICDRGSSDPVGFIQVSPGEAHDVGYALRRESWGLGYAREALGAVIAWARRQGYSRLTATHDVDNPRSGAVMVACGMTPRYAYREQWLPKKPEVVFCMHQIDLACGAEEYRGYAERWPVNGGADACSACVSGDLPVAGENGGEGRKHGA